MKGIGSKCAVLAAWMLLNAFASGPLRYEIVRGNFTWRAAQLEAEIRGGHLATITSSGEWDVLVQQFRNQLVGVYLGATNDPASGAWKWITGEPWKYEFWKQGEPNNTDGLETFLWLPSTYPVGWGSTSNVSECGFLMEREDRDSALHPLQIDRIEASSKGTKIYARGETNRIYELHASEDCVFWSEIHTFRGKTNLEYADLEGNSPKRFYRIEFISPPVITKEPVSYPNATLDAEIQPNVLVIGNPPFSYQWFFNDSPIAGAVGERLRLRRLVSTNSGSYYVVVSNRVGTVQSRVVVVNVPSSFAPDDLVGLDFSGTIHDGSGGFAKSGTFVIRFSDKDDSFVLEPTSPSVLPDQGTFRYSRKSSTTAELILISSQYHIISSLKFSSNLVGTYAAERSDGSRQIGEFDIIQ